MALRVSTGRERRQGGFSLIAKWKVLIHLNTSRGSADKLPSVGSLPSTAGRVFPEDRTLRLKLLLTVCRLCKLTSWQGDWHWPWDGFPRASSTKEPSPVWELFGNSSRHLDQRRHYTCNQFVQYFFHLTESSNAATKPLQGDQLLLFFYEFSLTDSKMAINCKTKPLSDTLHRNILIFWCDKKVWWKILFFFRD